MSISGIKNNIRIWETTNWTSLANIKDIYKTGNIFSSCFISDKNNAEIFIITSNCSLFKNSQPLKIYDLNGNYIKEINKSCEKTFYVGTYYDPSHSTNFIITVNKDNLKSYDYDKNEFYKKYQEIKDVKGKKMNFDDYHYNYTINNYDGVCQLFDSGDDGYLRIWDFHGGGLIKKIEIDKNCILSLCLWNSDYLFAASEDHMIKLIDIKAGVVIKEFRGHVDMVCTIKKIIHPQYGECLISQGYKLDQIKLWINAN
jgi:WD40 repeat protein